MVIQVIRLKYKFESSLSTVSVAVSIDRTELNLLTT